MNAILIINSGSSSIKFTLFEAADLLKIIWSGKLEGIGTESVTGTLSIPNQPQKISFESGANKNTNLEASFVQWISEQAATKNITAIGHRIVYGMQHTEPELITEKQIKEFQQISSYDPEHMPGALRLIAEIQKQWPSIPQIACFDTAFHRTMPALAKMLPIPRRFQKKGIERYGFHGLSYSWLLEELKKSTSPQFANGRLIFAHLGNGASMVAVKEGKSLDTSMGFTPSSGIPMSTRTGDIDPGLAWYLMAIEKLDPQQFSNLINHESGLKGISEKSGDMRLLFENESFDPQCAEAIRYFSYQAKKCIGALTTVLGGLDGLIFSGGIGENDPAVRSRICEGMEFLGIELDFGANLKSEAVISKSGAPVSVRVIPTNEEMMMARLVSSKMNYQFKTT